VITAAKNFLGCVLVLVGGFARPIDGFGVVCGQSFAMEVRVAEEGLGGGLSLFGCEL
jgi:hypothetical protein